jgi:phosphoglucomutase
MALSPLAGKPAPDTILTNIPKLMSAYYTHKPDFDNSAHKISFGTSGHRGSSLYHSFNETHILAISQALSEFRKIKNISGPLFLGMDTHALSEAAIRTAIEVFAANDVTIKIQDNFTYTPTPVISHAIIKYNKGRQSGFADGVVITPSHNPPEDGGFKYNLPNGGPADTDTTDMIQKRANDILKADLNGVRRWTLERALKAGTTQNHDYIEPYVADLKNIIDMDVISAAGLKIGVDPMGGSGIAYWEPIAYKYKLNIEVVNKKIDPTFSFMKVDRDGKIRMDCSSAFAMAGLIKLKDKFDIAFGNDPDFDRHGIVTKSCGLLNPNHFLAVSIWYLYQNRRNWKKDLAVGKTLVSSSIIDRLTHFLKRNLFEVPVGFKWFVDGLFKGTLGFAGEESAGASFLRRDGGVWTTDKDGIIMDLLAAEITAKTNLDPGEHFITLQEKFGEPVYERIDAPASLEQKRILKNLNPEMITTNELAGEKILDILTNAPGNKEAIGGLKIVSENGWFAARPSGTENVYKIYAESFNGVDHLKKIQQEAQDIVSKAFGD